MWSVDCRVIVGGGEIFVPVFELVVIARGGTAFNAHPGQCRFAVNPDNRQLGIEGSESVFEGGYPRFVAEFSCEGGDGQDVEPCMQILEGHFQHRCVFDIAHIAQIGGRFSAGRVFCRMCIGQVGVRQDFEQAFGEKAAAGVLIDEAVAVELGDERVGDVGFAGAGLAADENELCVHQSV